MRIIAGKAGRLAIKVPPAVTRPTTDFVRQAIFSILSDTIENARVLDLFAGSGSLGLESLSRGAATAVFVDEHRNACSVIQENLSKSKLVGGKIVKSDVSSFLKRDTSTYEVIFADPPYWKNHGDKDLATPLIHGSLVHSRLSPNGYLILEVSTNQPSPTSPQFSLWDRREYGSSAILIYRPVAIPPLAPS